MGPLLGFRSAASLDGHILSRVVFVPRLASLLQYWLQRPPVLKAKREDLIVESTDHRDVLGVPRSGQERALAWVSELPRIQHQFHRVVMTTKEHHGRQVRGTRLSAPPLPPQAPPQTSLMFPPTGLGSVASSGSLWLVLLVQAFKIMPLEVMLSLSGPCQPKLLALASEVPRMFAGTLQVDFLEGLSLLAAHVHC